MEDERETGDASEARETVLEVIERTSGEAPGVSLPEPDSSVGSSPVALEPSMDVKFSARVRGDYQVLGEVARGGMGAILRGHDRDLRRDVAIKVLDEELAKRPEIVRRFVEEAQIGGQLQHPGVVPVYELGLMADERPFFTMKLIKGRTLASMLNARKSPGDDLRGFLAIFEQICLTMAYAHSKRVIHRDLKPSNIMVGAFGEVQVVDWGLAKVLLRGGVADEKRALRDQLTVIETVRSGSSSIGSDSVVGSIMGTPAYMPPEQARGEVDELDERADVFALGALLCEILTGAPPYLEEEGGERLVVQAARGHLAPARQRIEESGADEELRHLCLDCLSPSPPTRPSGADAVSRAVHDYLSGTEERARQAQLAATEARVKVAEERKRRRLTVALAGTIVALLVAVGSGYLWLEQQREARVAENRARLDGLQASALELQAAGRHEEALSAAHEALELAESSNLGAEANGRATDFVARTEAVAEEAHAREDLERRNSELFEGLDGIHLLRTQSVAVTAADMDRAYAAAFRDFGLDLEADDLVETLEELRRRDMGTELALAIDDWARNKRSVHGWRSFEAEALNALAADLDPDEDRMQVRQALFEQDREGLLRMADEIDVSTLDPDTIWVLVTAVQDIGGEVRGLLERAVREYPDDFRFHMRLSDVYYDLELPEWALRHGEAAYALRPDHAYLLARLAFYNRQRGRFARSARLYAEVLERLPHQTGDLEELGFCHFMMGDYAEGISAFERAREANALSPNSEVELACLRFLAGLSTGDELAAALDAAVDQSTYNEQVEAWTLLVSPDPARRDPERALALAQALPRIPGGWLTEYCVALARHRLEQPEATLATITELEPIDGLRPDIACPTAAIRAMAHHRLGDVEAAREWLAQAQLIFHDLGGGQDAGWEHSSCLQLLREAEELVE